MLNLKSNLAFNLPLGPNNQLQFDVVKLLRRNVDDSGTSPEYD